MKTLLAGLVALHMPFSGFYLHGAIAADALPQPLTNNAMVAWELYGPGEEDYLFLTPAGLRPRVLKTSEGARIDVDFTLRRPGRYRLRAATVDTAGRTVVRWTPIVVTE